MKRYIILICFIFVIQIGHSQDKFYMNKDYFVLNESLTYNIYYNWGFIWIRAGEATLTTRKVDLNGKSVIRLMMEGRTKSSFDKFYYVRDSLISYIDPESFEPIQYEKMTHEGNWNAVERYYYKKLSNGSYRVVCEVVKNGKIYPIQVDTTYNNGFDMVATTYYFRMANPKCLFNKTDRTAYLRMNDGEYTVDVRYVKEDKIKIRKIHGKHSSRMFKIKPVAGKVYKGDKYINLWVSDDSLRVPLYIESPISVGNVKAVLKE